MTPQVNQALCGEFTDDEINFSLWVIANTSIDGGLEGQQEEHIVPKGAREEREACAKGKDEGKDAREEGEPNRHPGRHRPGGMPAAPPSKPAPRPA